MSARQESWSQPLSGVWAPVAALVAAALFFGSWGVVHYGFYTRHLLVDTPIYERYGDAMAAGAKLYPAVLLPLLLAWLWRRGGRREAAVGAGVFAALVTLCYLPFVALSPSGVWHSISVQASRPLQIESLGSSILLAAHQAV